MLVEEKISENRIRHYSNNNKYIKQIETNVLYEDAVDNIPCPFTYEETATDILEYSEEENH